MTQPPIPLDPGETVVLEGGRSWHFWLYTAVFVPLLCAMLPVAALPFVLSGRYWLTQRRLIFKSPLGQPRSLFLSELQNVEVVSPRATLTLRTARESVTIRFAEHFHRLWGALVLLGELPVPQQVAPPQVQYRASAGTAKFPGGWQQGFAVNFNRSVVFLPNEDARRTGVEAAKLAGQLALALVGVHAYRVQAQLPFDLWLSLWSHLPTDQFESLLHATAQKRGGKVVPLEQLEISSTQLIKAGEWSFSARQPLVA
jgi:hypothetical protein